MGKKSENSKLIMAVLAIAVVILAAALYVVNTTPNNKGSWGDTDQDKDTPYPPPEPVNPALITDNSGTLSLSVQNGMNTTAKQYLIATVRVYKAETPTQLFGTVTTIATGTGRGTLTIDKYDSNGNPQNYIYYVPAVDGSMTSTKGAFTAAENVEVNAKVANQSTLLFKVYDEENRGYVGETDELTGAYGTLQLTGQTFFSTTSNATGYAVGQGGYYDYTVYLSENGTASTSTQFEDGSGSLLIAIDASDLSDWNKPTISIPGATVTELKPGEYNDKIKNDGYDWVYSVTSGGKPYHIDSTFTKMRIQQYAKSATNPSDDIKVGLYTSGYYTHTLDDAMGLDTHKDDASQTAVYTVQDFTLSIS